MDVVHYFVCIAEMAKNWMCEYSRVLQINPSLLWSTIVFCQRYKLQVLLSNREVMKIKIHLKNEVNGI